MSHTALADAADPVCGTDAHATFVARALAAANKNILRMALYQQTQDPELLAMQVERRSRPGSPFMFGSIAREHAAVIERKALDYLTARGSEPMAVPSREDAERMMHAFAGVELSQPYLDFGWEDLGFEDFTRAASWTAAPPASEIAKRVVTIVGSGFSGIVCAIQLKRLGIPFRILERHSGIGGTWHVNDYPEARVDITSFIYQFKFELDYPWKSHYATQADLVDYIDHVVDKYEIRPAIELGAAVTDAVWDETTARWRLSIDHADGRSEQFESDFVISAAGLFSTPKLPDIPGIEGFEGKIWHTTAWDHDYDYTGKRVAVIGTGSTGSQLVRGVAAKAQSLTVYQRTPNWVKPVPGYRDAVTPELRWLLDHMPAFRNWYTFSHMVTQMEMEGLPFIDAEWQANGGRINRFNDALREELTQYIREKCGDDEDLFGKLVPDYAPLSRRLVVDNDWYDTLLRDNVSLNTEGIACFTETGIATQDGRVEDYDLVVLSAGFDVDRYLFPVDYTGRGGKTLSDLWSSDGARAHLTMYLPEYPNFAIMYGPNAGTTGGSFHSWVEVLSRHIVTLIAETIERGATSFEVREEAYRTYNEELDRGLETTLLVPEKAGGGYYLNSHGRPGVSSPWRLDAYYSYIAWPRLSEYHFE